MTERDLGTNRAARSRRRTLWIGLGVLVLLLALAGWQDQMVKGVIAGLLPEPAYRESEAMRAAKSDPQGTLQVIWEPTVLEPARSARQFVDAEGYKLLHLTVDSTNPDVTFTVYIDDPQRFG